MSLSRHPNDIFLGGNGHRQHNIRIKLGCSGQGCPETSTSFHAVFAPTWPAKIHRYSCGQATYAHAKDIA